MIFSLLSSCAAPTDSDYSGPTSGSGPNYQSHGSSPIGSDTPAPAPSSFPGVERTDVLIYGGTGSWSSETESLERILFDRRVTYQEVTSPMLDSMPLDELSKYALMIFPGGDAPTITKSLTADTHAKLREAVQKRGVDYLGFCAGAWLAISPAPQPGEDVFYGIGVVAGPIQQQNYLYKEGREFAIAKASFPDGTHRDLLWYGGPITPDIPGGVLAKYPDGTPAITQINSGEGLVIVAGLHPTANLAILNVLGLSDPEAIAPDYAWKLIAAGIHHTPLPAF